MVESRTELYGVVQCLTEFYSGTVSYGIVHCRIDIYGVVQSLIELYGVVRVVYSCT